jgi:hypothetical protein
MVPSSHKSDALRSLPDTLPERWRLYGPGSKDDDSDPREGGLWENGKFMRNAMYVWMLCLL